MGEGDRGTRWKGQRPRRAFCPLRLTRYRVLGTSPAQCMRGGGNLRRSFHLSAFSFRLRLTQLLRSDAPPEESMDFDYSSRQRELMDRVQAIMDRHVYPAEPGIASARDF